MVSCVEEKEQAGRQTFSLQPGTTIAIVLTCYFMSELGHPIIVDSIVSTTVDDTHVMHAVETGKF